jgi:hypothetical protein
MDVRKDEKKEKYLKEIKEATIACIVNNEVP